MTYTWYIVIVTGSISKQAIPDFPGKYWWALSLVFRDSTNNPWGGHPGLGTTYGSGFYSACLVVSEKIKDQILNNDYSGDLNNGLVR
jgi:hypothetical protein